jgi:TonB family protein
VSAVAHALAAAALVLAVGIWGREPRVYVVNLVPAVAALGTPAGLTVAPATPARPRPPAREEARQAKAPAPRQTPPPAKRAEAPPAPRQTPPPASPPEAAPAPSQTPPPPSPPEAAPAPREAPPAPPAALPELSPREPRVATRPAALPRPGEKELPPLTASAGRRPPPAVAPQRSPEERPRPASAAPAAVPPIPLGRPTGAPAGVASLSLEVSDFPFTYYLRQVQQKVSERWVPPARESEPGRRAVILFEIHRDGQVTNPHVEKTSGNPWYDQSALRAVLDATPFPPLPQEFPAESLRVHFGFDFVAERG